MSIRVALKYCGGCNSGFDRVEYFNAIRAAAGSSIEWVTPDDPDVQSVLIIAGCDTACPAESFESPYESRVVLIKDDRLHPRSVVEALYGKGER